MRQQRVIFILTDGRRKYATHRGAMLSWDKEDIESLQRNIDKFGMPVFTADFQKFGFDYEDLRLRFPKARIVHVKSVELEDYYQPLDNNVIF